MAERRITPSNSLGGGTQNLAPEQLFAQLAGLVYFTPACQR